MTTSSPKPLSIYGLQRVSFVDYPQKIAAVVFTPGCNLRCPFCHNQELVTAPLTQTRYSPEAIADFLSRRKGQLDAVVISGGEPTLQPGLADFLAGIRQPGLATKLDTNGTRPDVLKSLLAAGLLDYVAMDIKGPCERSEAICGCPVDTQALRQSIRLLQTAAPAVEFRTTCIPELTPADIQDMAALIAPASRYVLQAYRCPGETTLRPAHAARARQLHQQAQAALPQTEVLLRGV